VITRIKEAVKERERRRFFVVYLGGKMLGLGLALLALYVVSGYLHPSAWAQGDDSMPAMGDVVNATNTVWVLVTAFLVFWMNAGFMMLEAGFARTREVSNILLECIVDTALCGILFWAVGFAFMFGEGNGLIGHQYFFLNGATGGYGTTGVAFLAFFVFQLAFADASLLAAAKLGILTASAAAGVLGVLLGRLLLPEPTAGAAETADEAEASTER